MSASAAPQVDPRWGDYEGEGIWYVCDDCGHLTEIEDEDGDFRNLLEDLCEQVSQSSRDMYTAFDIGSGGGRWDVLPDDGLFKFTNANGRVAISSYGVVSSWNENTHSWMWAWGFPDGWTKPKALEAVNAAYRAGVTNDWQAVTKRLLAVNEHEAWHLTNLVAHLNGWPMVYRARVNEMNWHYFALSRPVWAN